MGRAGGSLHEGAPAWASDMKGHASVLRHVMQYDMALDSMHMWVGLDRSETEHKLAQAHILKCGAR